MTFLLRAPSRTRNGPYWMKVVVYAHGNHPVELARFYLKLTIDRRAKCIEHRVPQLGPHVPHDFFASYSRKNQQEVMGRVSTLASLDFDVFLDCLDLKEGRHWEDEIATEVVSREGFLLFWSTAARSSTGLRRNGNIGLHIEGCTR